MARVAHSIQEHTLPRPEGLIECKTVLDVGAGIRPMQWYKPERHICVEPYAPYCKVLEAAGYEVWRDTAQWALLGAIVRIEEAAVDAVYLLDVIEHLEKPTGRSILHWACRVARVQVIVYTPYGFKEQTKDAWGMGGDMWQTHRSGWTPDDFHRRRAGWRTKLYQPGRYAAQGYIPPTEGFYALWEPTSTPR